MKIETLDEQETIQDGISALMAKLPRSKVARLLSLWKIGRSDYTASRHKLFDGDSLEDLYQEALEFQKAESKHSGRESGPIRKAPGR